jgi:hypothetical protein
MAEVSYDVVIKFRVTGDVGDLRDADSLADELREYCRHDIPLWGVWLSAVKVTGLEVTVTSGEKDTF